ncbi:conserved hypothetical protein [Leifsonia xyli subsp. xyli str. CTCB07]|uniref:N-acetyltransferase domain-containing protein n=2 Tax=Leifsonia xyli subsp. xyli TaxID=59736 RepID=Q6ACB1_LEIXX|nr:conserved hypothetical protein [Leifsonia xyli subsp. xyli str. CTCB07]
MPGYDGRIRHRGDAQSRTPRTELSPERRYGGGMAETYRTASLDEHSARALAANGLRLALVDTADEATFTEWIRSGFRGFHDRQPSDKTLAEARGYLADRRTTAVYEDDLPNAWPVGTVNSWVAPLTVPGGGTLDTWAISSVTVSPTHRRRGMATALLGAELRTAHRLGVPVAVLTVSESVIYGRWGFGPATYAASWAVDTKRVRWAGGDTPGRLAFTSPDEYRETGHRVLDRAMAARAGEIGMTPFLADQLIGPLSDTPDREKHRLVRYDSPAGEPEGFVSFTVTATDDVVRHTVEVRHLAAATDAALAALWRFLLELDLVAVVKASIRDVDEPLQALVSDVRGAQLTGAEDHLWMRILDVPASLEARSYERDGSLVLEVTDDLGMAAGRYRLTVAGGAGRVERTDDAAEATLPVAALGSVYLGHDSARALGVAGRIRGDVAALDRLFRTSVPTRLSMWF